MKQIEERYPGKERLTSDAFHAFMREAPRYGEIWQTAVFKLVDEHALDDKTASLAYLAVLSALRLVEGVPFTVAIAKEAGASRDEVISAVLVGLPAAGNAVIRCLPVATQAYDSKGK